MHDIGIKDLVQPLFSDSSQNVQDGDPLDFFRNKTVLLTGATGNLGGCILFKLTAVLYVRKIFVLCRGSAALAKITIVKNMPLQAKDVLLHPAITFVQGDMLDPDFAISKDQLEQLEQEVHIIINAAADISLAAPLAKAIDNNCKPPLELARMATKFQNLEHFIQISTAYSNSFLPDGIVEEKIYPLGDPESELKEACEKGSTQYVSQFPAPYYYAKHLMERLLTKQFPNLPILLIRPTTIAEAIEEPYRLYGVEGSCPLTTFYHIYIDDPGNATWHVDPETGRTTGSNIIDVIPVDWVAKLVLLHATTKTKGIVHTGAESYRVGTFDSWEIGVRASVPKEIRDWMAPTKFTHDQTIEECPAARFFTIGTRDWRFSNKASAQFLPVQGPLHISVDDHEPADHVMEMVGRITATVIAKKTKQKVRALYGQPSPPIENEVPLPAYVNEGGPLVK